MAQTKKTDNSYLIDKVALRIKYSPEKITVLDCFSGKGVIWEAVKMLSGRSVKSLPIDQRSDNIGFHLTGDNSGYLETLDLAKFNVIDLDAYGVPFEQLEILFKRNYSGRVFVTFIQSIFGMMPKMLLAEIGFTEAQIDKCPSLFNKRGWEYFKQYLAKKGVREIAHRSHARKHYLTFYLNGADQSYVGCDNPQGDNLASRV